MDPIVTPLSEMDLSMYGGLDPRELPAYSIAEAAHNLRIHTATLRYWVRGKNPLIKLASDHPPSLSFKNIIEAHILDGMRYRHKIPMGNIRSAIENLRSRHNSAHPLADWQFSTDNVHLYIEESGLLLQASKGDQIVMRTVVEAYLSRIEVDRVGAVRKLYPFIRNVRPTEMQKEPKVIVIDPLIAFGRPVLVKRGVPTEVIYDRYRAGDSVSFLAKDYDCFASEINAAIKYEQRQESKKAA
jgi:uncharacterized protein (DUF433 family)